MRNFFCDFWNSCCNTYLDNKQYFINALTCLWFFTICHSVIVLQKTDDKHLTVVWFLESIYKEIFICGPLRELTTFLQILKPENWEKFKIWGWWRLKVNYIFWDRLWSLQLILLKGLFQQSSHLSLGKVFNYTELPLLTHTLCRPSWDTVRAHEDVQTSWFFNSRNLCLTHLNDESFNQRSLKL